MKASASLGFTMVSSKDCLRGGLRHEEEAPENCQQEVDGRGATYLTLIIHCFSSESDSDLAESRSIDRLFLHLLK